MLNESNTICQGCVVITPSGLSAQVVHVEEDCHVVVKYIGIKSHGCFSISDLILEKGVRC